MLTVSPASHPLRGELNVPGDKSISHRSIMFGALAEGDTRITGFLSSADCLSTIACFRAMGIPIESDGSEIVVHGRGLNGLSEPEQTLDAGNSGTTTRLMAGVLSAQSFSSIFTGDASIRQRPMRRILEPLTAMGASIRSMHGDGCAPLVIAPGHLHDLHWRSPVASAQVKSCILLAGLCGGVEVSVTEPTLSRDHTERMLRAFGAELTDSVHPDGSATALLRGSARNPLRGRSVNVPGDISSAAYWIVAALLVSDSELLIRNVGINPTRAGILQVLRRLGADITLENRDDTMEPRADLRVRYSRLRPETDENGDFVIGGEIIPTLIDELPILAVLATRLPCRTVIRDAAELRVKECDRIQVMTDNLKRMGADIEAAADGFSIEGGKPLHGAPADTHSDHRIAMSLSIAALAADSPVTIDDADCVCISYPTFYSELSGLCKVNDDSGRKTC